MRLEQLRKALSELNGERDCVVAFAGIADAGSLLNVPNAMLIPDEGDELVKLTDGKQIYILNAGQVMWIKIALSGGVHR